MYQIQEFFFSIGLIKKNEWGNILIASIITTPIGGLVILFYYWIKTYKEYRKSNE